MTVFKKIILAPILILTLVLIIAQQPIAQQKAEYPYLGQKVPGKTPEVFAPGLVSTGNHEFSCTFSPDGKEFYFARGTGTHNKKAIMVTKEVNGIWSEPVIAFPEFKQENFEPHITPDGNKIFFMGMTVKSGQPRPDIDMHYALKDGDEWGEIKRMDKPFNPKNSMYVTTTIDGTIYTTHAGVMDIVRSKLVKGKYQDYENLGPPVNTDQVEFYPFIAPDESYIIYGGTTPSGPGLMASFKMEDGSWANPKAIPIGMNGGCPMVTPDGKYLFFVAGRPNGDIHWVDISIVMDLK